VLSSPPASRADRTAETRSRWAGVSRSSESLIRCVIGPASAAPAADSGTRSLNDWLACWFCCTPVETQGDAAAAGMASTDASLPRRARHGSDPARFPEPAPAAPRPEGRRYYSRRDIEQNRAARREKCAAIRRDFDAGMYGPPPRRHAVPARRARLNDKTRPGTTSGSPVSSRS
jgi:hypothetical protein